jgi:outer membrane murein-binding lipoprotein Lpp
MHRAATVLLAGILLSGCAPGFTPSPAASPPSELAAKYLELAATSNAATCTFNAALSQSAPTLDALKQASADFADSLDTFINGLGAIVWVPPTSADVDDLAAALREDESTARTMASAGTLSAFITADNQLIAHNSVTGEAAHRLRQDLGLPSAGNPCTT